MAATNVAIRGQRSLLRQIREAFVRWGERHHYGSVGEVRGRVSLTRTPDPARFERSNYIRVLHSHGGVS